MIETLLGVDRAIFMFINVTLANPVTDFVMPIITDDWALRILYALTLIGLAIKGDRRVRLLLLFSLLALLISDQLSSAVLKPLVGRHRPCQQFALESFHLLVNCGAGLSMPSSHAANAFAQATLFGAFYREFRWPLLVVAFLIAISRIFVGVHFPADVIAGSLIGVAVGLGVFAAYRKTERRLFSHAVSN